MQTNHDYPQNDPEFEPKTLIDEEIDLATVKRPNGALWMYYLFFRPAIFFRSFVIDQSPLLTALAAWMMGITGIVDRLDQEALRGEFNERRRERFAIFMADWSSYWMLCLFGGLLGAILYFKLGGWWYIKRLQFSGANNPEPRLARRVYLFASQIHAIPAVIYTAWATRHYATPAAAWEGDDMAGYALLVFPFWSAYASYRGVRTAFSVRRWAARMWFLVLPSAVYSLVFVGIATALFLTPSLLATKPDLKTTHTIDRTGFTLTHPGNWSVDTQAEDYDADHEFLIESLMDEAQVSFTLFDEPIDPAEQAQNMLAALNSAYKINQKIPIERWGPHRGSGYRLNLEIEGTEFWAITFHATGKSSGFEVLEICDETIVASQEPGFELIRNTFQLKSQP